MPQELAPELIKVGTRDIKTKERKKSNDNLQNKITEGKNKQQKQKTTGKQKQWTESILADWSQTLVIYRANYLEFNEKHM